MVRVIFSGLLLVAITSYSVANGSDLIDLLESKNFVCGLHEDNPDVSFCKKANDNVMIEYYFKDGTINVAASKTFDLKDEYKSKEVLDSLREYCGYAFDKTFGDGSEPLKEMLQHKINQKSDENNFAYSSIISTPNYEMKMVTVTTLEQKGKYDTDIGLLCFVYPSPAIY